MNGGTIFVFVISFLMISLTLSGLNAEVGWSRGGTPVKLSDATAQARLSFGEGDLGSQTLLASGQSWNSNVSCTPVITTFEQIIGTPLNPNQGGLLSSSPWATHEFGYVDSNGNNAYDPGEPVIYDENRDGVVDVVPGTNDPTYAAGGNGGDRLLNGVNSTLVSGSLLGQALKQDAKLRYIDGSSTTAYYNTTNGSWDAGGKGEHGETVVYDANDNKIVDSNDIVVSGGPRAPSSTELGKPLQTVVFGGTFNKRATNPPCTVTNAQGQTISNFVEIHGVYPLADSPSWVYETADCNTTYNGINGGGPFPNNQKLCDSTGNWQTFGFRGSCSTTDRTACSHRVHFEMDRDWFAKGYCSKSSTICNNSTLTQYAKSGASGGSVSFDIQGFVYWDPTEYNKTAHSFSGWEIHPFTAWRISPPNASFNFTPTNPVVGEVVNFTATGSNGVAPYTCSWNFGDGSTGTGRSVLHTYTTKGTFMATVSLTDSETPPQTASSSQSVIVNPVALMVTFTVTPASPIIGQSVNFTATGSGGTTPYAFTWAFGDDGIGAGKSVLHAYATEGAYTVMVTITDANAKSTTFSQTVNVIPPPITASFAVSPSAPTVGRPVNFTATVSGGSAPYTFSWKFGDTTEDTGNLVSHAYNSAGTFTVTLTVIDANNIQATASHIVSVASQPIVLTVTFSPLAPTESRPVSFNATVVGGTPPFTFRWNFGDSASGEGAAVSHAYANSGRYVASMTVVDTVGGSATWSETIEVSSPQQPQSVWQQYWYLSATILAGGVLSTILILRNRLKVFKNNPNRHSNF